MKQRSLHSVNEHVDPIFNEAIPRVVVFKKESCLLSEFIPGQRWISNTESDLGLGIVVEVANRRVVIIFPAVDEERTYAMDNAPLSRVIYPVGERVSSSLGVTITITDAEELEGCIVYNGVDRDGDHFSFEEMDLDSSVHFSKPSCSGVAVSSSKPLTSRASASIQAYSGLDCSSDQLR